MLGHLAELLGDWLAVLAGSGDRTRIGQLQDDIRAEMARLEIVAGEARQERQTYLANEFDPDPLVRTVFRLPSDGLVIGLRALYSQKEYTQILLPPECQSPWAIL
jgi:hypothetical protein